MSVKGRDTVRNVTDIQVLVSGQGTVHNVLMSMKGLMSIKGRGTVHNVLMSMKGRGTVHNVLVSVAQFIIY